MSDKKKSVLIAEDSSVIHDLVKLFLTRRGHTVTVTTDGSEALEMLLSGNFDIALIDYHLPTLDGVEVVRRFVDAAGGRKLPRFLAMTADTKGFLAAGVMIELFEQVLPKPFDIDKLIDIVEAEDAPETRTTTQVNTAPSRPGSTRPRPFAELGQHILYYPEDFDPASMKVTRMRLELEGAPDAVILMSRPDPAAASAMFDLPGIHLSPVLDTVEKLLDRADYGGVQDVLHGEKVMRAIEEFAGRRARVHPDFNTPADIDERIMARAYVAGGRIEARLSPALPSAVAYSLLADPRDMEEAVARLERQDLISSTFVDRLHVCPSCRSSRLLVSETCISCGSSQLTEESYIHHLKCAYQGPESDFYRGDDLYCPKCARELTSFGVDYDRPGVVLMCAACGTAMSDPGVSFRCLDCYRVTAGDKIETRDVYSYALTQRGRDTIESGRMGGTTFGRIFRFSELPIPIITQLSRFASTDGEKSPFALVVIRYPALRQLERDHGAGLVDRMRQNLKRRMIELLAPDTHASGGNADYLLLNSADVEDLRVRSDTILYQALNEVGLDLEPAKEILTARDIF